jgi:hypothetical protein
MERRRVRGRDIEPGALSPRTLAAGSVQTRNVTRYAVNRDGLYPGSVGNSQIGPGAVTGPQIDPETIDVSRFTRGLRPVQLVDSLPPLPDAEYPPDEAVVFHTGEGKLYRNVNNVWTAAVPVIDLEGQITETQIADDSISTPKLRAASVEANNLAANSVTSDKLAANSVTSGVIQAGAVRTQELAADAVTADKLAAISLQVGKFIRSANYVAGSQGWAIDANGTVEFAQGIFRGTVQAATVTGSSIVGSTLTGIGNRPTRIAEGPDGISSMYFGFRGTAAPDARLYSDADFTLVAACDTLRVPGQIQATLTGSPSAPTVTVGSDRQSGIYGNTSVNVSASGVRSAVFHPTYTNIERRLQVGSNNSLSVSDTAPRVVVDDQGVILAYRNNGGPAFFGRSNDGAVVSIRRNGVQVGTIAVSGSSTSFNTTSDSRLKRDPQPIVDAMERVRGLGPVRHRWPDSDVEVDGLMAEQVYEVAPYATVGEPGLVDHNGDPVPMMVDLSKLVPLLAAGLAELEDRVDVLEGAGA